MSKRWTEKEDRFLFDYFDDLGDFVGTHDLGRPAGAAAKRVQFLKKCGAWAALKAEAEAYSAYYCAVRGRPWINGQTVFGPRQ